MVLFNYSTKEITAKIVFYGPGLCGKTTNLQFIYDNLPATINKGKMLSLATKTDRTLFFDFLPIDLGTIRGLRTRLQLYTVPGQVFYNTTRKLVLKGADGVVFVADSQRRMAEANLESFRNLEENLAEHDMKLSEIPLILQFNKRDLPDVQTVEELNAALNKHNAPIYEAVATTGIGVHETLRGATRLVLNSLKERYADRKEERVAPAVQAAALAAARQRLDARPDPAGVTSRTESAPPRAAAVKLEPAAPPPMEEIEIALATPAASPEPEILPLDAPGFSASPARGTEAWDAVAPAAQDGEPVLDLVLDDDIPLELAVEEPPLELELDLDEPAAAGSGTSHQASALDDSLSLPDLDEAAPDPLMSFSIPQEPEQDDRPAFEPMDVSGALPVIELDGSVEADGIPLAALDADPLQKQGHDGDSGIFSASRDDMPFPDLEDPALEAGAGQDLSREAAWPPPSPGEDFQEPAGGAFLEPLTEDSGPADDDLEPVDEEPFGVALEDSHDDMLRVPPDVEPVRREPAPAARLAAEPSATQVVSVDAAPAGQKEIHVPLELAIGGQSIRFELRISLDLSRGAAIQPEVRLEDPRP